MNERETASTRSAKRKPVVRVLSLVPAVASIIALIVTQDFTQPMAFFDSWSIMFGVIVIVQAALAAASRSSKEDDDNTQNPYGQPTQTLPTV